MVDECQRCTRARLRGDNTHSHLDSLDEKENSVLVQRIIPVSKVLRENELGDKRPALFLPPRQTGPRRQLFGEPRARGQAHAGPLLQLGSARRHTGVSTCQSEPRASQASPRSRSSRRLRQMVPRSIGMGQTLDVGRALQRARWALPRLQGVLRSERARAISCRQLAQQELLSA